MSHYSHHLYPPSDLFNYTMITPQYSPDTTVAISLRQFEKEAKAEAERDYDAKHGPLPEPPAEDDDSVDIKERAIMKRGRKVRSAIVSRKKTAIYEKKLEKALQQSDNINNDLKAKLSVQEDVLRGMQAKINSLRRKRMRTNLPQPPLNPVPQTNNLFLPEDDPIDEILSIPPEQPRQFEPIPKSFHNVNDYTSECSDRQISPMVHPQRPDNNIPGDFQSCLPGEDNSWKAYVPENIQPPVVHMLGATYAM